MRPNRQFVGAIAVGFLMALASVAAVPSTAAASKTQISIFEDDPQLLANPVGTLSTLRALGVNVIRVTLPWASVAPRPNSYKVPKLHNQNNPASYAGFKWAPFDRIIKDAQRDGIAVDMDLNGPAPLWATSGGPRNKPHPFYNPSTSRWAAFVHAVGERYSGSYRPRRGAAPLPRVTFWSIWSEPNLGYALEPQGVPNDFDVLNAGHLYRMIVDAAWGSLNHTGHRGNTFLIGELAPRGGKHIGIYSSTQPLTFLRWLYCLDDHYHQLRGAVAHLAGCPTTAAGSKHFRSENPALFDATGVSVHPWSRDYPPDIEAQPQPNYASLAELGGVIRAVDHVQSAYGSHAKLPIYNTEYGYITNPPSRREVSPKTASDYLNWAEYISWKNPRIVSFDQFLLRDPYSNRHPYVGWSSGLTGPFRGTPKATFSAWRLPLYLPVTSTRRGHRLEVWGCVRPVNYAFGDTGQAQLAELQFRARSGGPWSTLKQLAISTVSDCYFDVHLPFTQSGDVRLSYTYPAGDKRLPAGKTVHSRLVAVTVR